MKRALFLFLLAGSSVFAAHDLSRYEAIIDRAPFGKEPPPGESAASAQPAGEFARQYRLCMLYEGTTGQLKAGIVSKVNNKNFFLQVGESEAGLSLIEVRLEEGVAILRQGGETAQLILEGLATPLSSVAAVASLPSEPAPAQQIRRAGKEAAPEHILAALNDSSPKQPRITVRKTKPASSGDSANFDENSTALSAGAEQTVVAAAPAAGNYLVQSVPKRYNPF
jgi:hypothetical protein